MSLLAEVKSQLEKMKPELLEKYPLAYIGIFGSVARGDDTDISDVDILVEFTKPVGMQFIDLANELEAKLGRKVDLATREGFKERYWKYVEPDIIYV
jgi:uncharacterized protein